MATTSPDAIIIVSPSNDLYVKGVQQYDMLFATTCNIQSICFGYSNIYMKIASNGNVGIGTSNPSALLDVAGTINVRSNMIILGQNTTSNLSVYNNATLCNAVNIYGTTTISNALFVYSNVGIGTSNPGYSLDIVGDINFSGALRKNGITYSTSSGGSGGSQWSNNSSNVFLNGSNVGLGTSSPAYTLDVAGDLQVRSNLILGNNTANFRGIKIQKNPNGTAPYNAITNIATNIPGCSNSSNLTTVYSDFQISSNLILTNTMRMRGLYIQKNSNVSGTPYNVTSQISSITGFSNSNSISTVYASNYVNIVSSNVEVIRFNSNGYVGIGTTNPAYPLDVNGSQRIIGSSNLLTLQTATQAQAFDLSIISGNTQSQVGVGWLGKIIGINIANTLISNLPVNNIAGNCSNASAISFSADYSSIPAIQFFAGTTGAGSNIPSRMSITHAGYVGIGTSNPQSALDVRGTTYIGTNSGNTQIGIQDKEIKFQGTGTRHYSIFNSNGLLSFNDTSTTPYTGTYGTAIMAINGGNGYVGIGTANPTASLHVNGTSIINTSATGGILLGNLTSAAPTANAVVQISGVASSKAGLAIYTTDTGSQSIVEFINPNGRVGTISMNGSTTSYNTSSDYRLKTNIEPLTNIWNQFMQLNPVTYNFKSDLNTTIQGFIAHEVQEIVPIAVSGEKDAIDSDNNPIYQGMDASKLIPLLVAALKDLKSEFEAYKAAHP